MLAITALLVALPPQTSGTSDADRQAHVDHAVVVHADNASRELSSERLRRILRAEIQEWPNDDRIELLLPRSGTRSKQALLDRVYGMSDIELKRYWTQMVYEHRIVAPPQAAPSTTVALGMIERTRGGLTVVPADELDFAAVKVATAAIDATRPGDPAYPLWSRDDDVARTEPAPAPDGAPREASAASADDDDLDARVNAILDRRLAEQSLERSSHPIHWYLFGHAEAELERERVEGTSDTGGVFSIESVDLVVTSALSDRWSVLVETVIDAQDDGDYDVDVERLLLNYRHSDALQLQGGRFLTGIGYWNSRYHHGEWLQTSIDRPEILSFEDDDAFLPLHNVGVGLHGGVYLDAVGLDYKLELANGRGPTPETTQTKEDENDLKAVNLSLGVEPGAMPGLRLGGGVYFDKIPPNEDPGEGTVHDTLDERITNVFVAYQADGWEVMGEYFWIDHDDGAMTTDSSGWYGQVGKRCGAFTPYVRFDASDRDDADLYWSVFEDTEAFALGVRYDATEWGALTLQYERAWIDLPPGDPNERTDTLVLQASFVL